MSEILLEARGLTRRFGGVVALGGVDLTQRAGETLGMIGPNGSGKTTFVNIVSGHLRPTAGTVLFDGRPIAGKAPNGIAAAGLTRTYQAVRVFGALSAGDNVATALVDAATPMPADGIDEAANWLGLAGRLDARAGSMTLFEQRKLEILMRLVQRPRLIMLDEPVGGLSAPEVRAMIEVLSGLKARVTLFVIEHTMKVIRELADRVVVLLAGEKLAEGPPAQVLADPKVIESYLGSADAHH